MRSSNSLEKIVAYWPLNRSGFILFFPEEAFIWQRNKLCYNKVQEIKSTNFEKQRHEWGHANKFCYNMLHSKLRRYRCNYWCYVPNQISPLYEHKGVRAKAYREMSLLFWQNQLKVFRKIKSILQKSQQLL